ncbi:ATP-binding protein [Hymenobacter sp. BT770]|uniref:tetratricopeptide repeat-containing sensor histidine kinase n=1 Tax=Hymenobacter sp. BT770 TaxID=2886942 RepID=UPI001D0FCFB1|nr:ATP-binding protein [Hymenobacter sp. BT770]MCC3153746.1 histidine kinase [Hymenobacter sp. BT770]MDO3416880.1 ATP-binding protein [Hymenobacter sp. BT770]
MNIFLLLLLWWAGPESLFPAPQHDARIDSLQRLLATAPPDSARVLLLAQLAYEHTQTAPLSTIYYGQQALQLAQKLQFPRGEAWALVRLGSGFREAGNYPAALQVGLQGLRMAEALHDPELIGRATNALGYLNWEQGNSRTALAYLFRAKTVAEKSQNVKLLTRVMGNIGNVYVQLNRLDSALLYSQKGYALDLNQHDLTSEVGDAAMLGNIYSGLGRPQLAQRYYRSSIARATGQRITFALCRAYLGQARLYQRQHGPTSDSALYSGRQALAAGQLGQYPKGILEASQFLASAYAARRDSAAAFRYLTLASTTRDSLFSRTKMAQVQALDVSERLRQQELADQAAEAAAERRYHWLLAALASTLPALLLLWLNNRHKQRANQQLNAQNAQIAHQRDELSSTLEQLQATQAQLVQSEKMAFLGELTAGIAHELQNPLAFVKNFADVSALLVDDMADGSPHRPTPDHSQGILLAGLKQNLREISEHGQRATSIISGMLARSRNGSAPLAPTNLNQLTEEYLRLAYQGLRAKDPSFHAARTKHLAPNLRPVPAVASDLGRVLLNLFTNAFYAVQQRQKLGEAGYVGEVSVSTRQLPTGYVEIRVRDNGTGIPEAVKEKVFQPFFTTKPTHEGTGLGLSLSHDIVTQSHGGTLTVESQEGEFTEFIICLPG